MAITRINRKDYLKASVLPNVKAAYDAEIEAGRAVLVDSASRGANGDEYIELATQLLPVEQVETLKAGLAVIDTMNELLDKENLNAELQMAYKTVDSKQAFGVKYAKGETSANVRKRLKAERDALKTKKS